MIFSQSELKEARPVTQHVFAQTIGVLGNVNDQARVHNKQVAIGAPLDLAVVRNIAEQVRQAMALLPTEKGTAIEPVVADLEKELGGSQPDQSKIRRCLASIRATCEGAAGNLAAEGVLALLAKLPGLAG
jgi:hypothetical protein